jgi:multiple sugar transport system substrate-binding protein
MAKFRSVIWGIVALLGGCVSNNVTLGGGADGPSNDPADARDGIADGGTGNEGDRNGPADSSDVQAPLTITYLRSDSPSFAQADDFAFGEYMRALPHVTVQTTTVRQTSLSQILLAELKADRLPADLVRVPPSWVCSFADNLADVPAAVISLAEAQVTFFSAPLAASTCGGTLKALPLEYNLEYGGVVVNLTKYRSKYGSGATPAWATWSDFIRQAAELTEYNVDGAPQANGLDIAMEWPQPAKHIFLAQILQRGGAYRASDGTFNFTSQAAREALAEMVKWVVTDKVMHTSLIPGENTFVTVRLAWGATSYGWNDPAKPLSIMGYVGSWGLPNVLAQLPADAASTYAFQALPPMFGSQHRFVQNGGWALAVARTSRNPEAAWALAKSLALSPEAMRRWAATAGTLPALRVNGTPQAAAGDPILAKVQPLLDQGQWIGHVPAAAIETVEGTIMSNFFAAVKRTKTIEQALVDMQQTANAAIQSLR